MTSVDISSFLLITAADIPCLKLCWYWSIIRLFKGEITIETCRVFESMSKIKDGKRKHILFPNPVWKTPTQCFFSIKLFTTDTCWSFNSKLNWKIGLILSSNNFLTESGVRELRHHALVKFCRVPVFRINYHKKIKWKYVWICLI